MKDGALVVLQLNERVRSPSRGGCERKWLRCGGVAESGGYRGGECKIVTLSGQKEKKKAIKEAERKKRPFIWSVDRSRREEELSNVPF